jgi:integrase
MKRSNRPGRGAILKVDPIRNPDKIDAIKRLLAVCPRDLLLFVLGINTNLRVCDILGITFSMVRGLRVGDVLLIRESKTKKIRRITLNRTVWGTLQAWLVLNQDQPQESAIFWSRKTGQALTVPAVNSKIKRWCKAVGLKGRFGCHSLRKTFGYQHRTRFGTDLPTLMVMYNHSNQRQTLDYLGIMEEDVEAAYLQEI